jgi:Condensation domain
MAGTPPVQSEEPRAVRALSGMERGIYEVDLGAPLNFTTASRVSGPLTAELIRLGLPAVRARHPALRWRIFRDAAGVPHFHEGGAPELTVREARGENHLFELEWEINTPIDASVGPLVRFALVECGAGGRWLLVTLHHAIGDGMSGAFLVRDLVQACAQAAAGRAPALEPLEAGGAMDLTLPASARGLPGLENHLRFVGREAWLQVRHGKTLRVRRDLPGETFAYQRRARVIPRAFDAAFGDRLGTRARAESTTVHGALAAAMLLEILADAGEARACVTFGSPANVRANLVPAVGEQVGFYASMIAFRGLVRADASFWDVARAVRRQAEAELARGGQLSILALMSAAGRSVMGIGKVPPRTLIERWERTVPATTGLTNLCRVPIEPVHGPFTLECCYFAVSPSALGDFLATATSLHRRIDWIFIWPDPVMTEAHALALVDGIVARLERAL